MIILRIKNKILRIIKIQRLKRLKKQKVNLHPLVGVNNDVIPQNNKSFEINIFNQKVDYESINWHKDYKSGFIYPKKRFDKIKIHKLFNKGIDVKFPWELSRFQFGIDLALIYKANEDESYYHLFKSLIKDWISDNPFLIGVNWTCTMDVAIRAANWVITANLFDDTFWNDETFVEEISKSLLQHACYIESFPEIGRYGKSNNHLISNYSGLYILALSLKSHFHSKKWKEIAKNGLEQCMREQVLEDGTDFENSIPYHRLVVELFSIPLILNLSDFSDFYKIRLFRMFEFTSAYIDQKGNAPQIGDNDSGIFIKMSKGEELNHMYLLSLGKSIFGYDFGRNDNPDYIPIFKSTGYKVNLNNFRDCLKSISFDDSGYYFLKNKNMFVSVFCPKSTKGHRHFDTGSFTVSYKGTPIIVDPGTGCYTSDLEIRKRFRDYPSHNVYYFNIENKLNTHYFGIDVNTTAHVITFTKDTLIYYVVFENGTRVERKFKLSQNILAIEDHIEGSIENLYTVLHFSNYAELITEGVKQVIEENYLYSPKYSVVEKKNKKTVIVPTNNLKLKILCN